MLVSFQFLREYGKPNPVLRSSSLKLVSVPYMRYDSVHHNFIAFAEVKDSFTSNHPMGEISRNPKPRVMLALCAMGE